MKNANYAGHDDKRLQSKRRLRRTNDYYDVTLSKFSRHTVFIFSWNCVCIYRMHIINDRKLCVRWVPNIQSEERKMKHKESVCFLTRFREKRDDALWAVMSIRTVETHFNPHKETFKECFLIGKYSLSDIRLYSVQSFRIENKILHVNFLPQGNSDTYCEGLRCVI